MEAATPFRTMLKWIFVAGLVLAVWGLVAGIWLAIPLVMGLVLAAFWAWWAPQERPTDQWHCAMCGYPFPEVSGDRPEARRCPECGSVD